MSDILCPVKPHELDKVMRRGIESIVERVAGAAVIHNLGRDLLLLVYMAGFFHAFEATSRRRDRDGSPKGEDAERLSGEAMPARAEGIANA